MKSCIVYAHCNPEGGGVWQAVLQFSLELIRQGHETLAVTTDQPLAPRLGVRTLIYLLYRWDHLTTDMVIHQI